MEGVPTKILGQADLCIPVLMFKTEKYNNLTIFVKQY